MLLSGNEAVALGAYEAGVLVGTGYPGTPSTEILENLSKYPGVYTEWSVNEKVALEVGIGASLAGARTLVTMKHVGLNVAADPLFTSSYIGVRGGLVIINADDPDLHSSQNEQDNRNYAYAAKIPLLEPSDLQEVKDFTGLAFDLSEEYNTPVMLRTVTRIAHSRGIVFPASAGRQEHPAAGFVRNIPQYVMIPAYARKRHAAVEERQTRLAAAVNRMEINRMELGDPACGIITSGICYAYVREAFPDASILKIATVNPLPVDSIADFCRQMRQVVVVEELDPFLEMRIRALGFPVEGKRYFSLLGEFNPELIYLALKSLVKGRAKKFNPPIESKKALPPRPPQLCPGCPHREVFLLLKKRGAVVSGDIGCYTLGALPPFLAMDTCIDMGASIGVAQGMEIAEGKAHKHNTVAVIGDSTFAHSGITGLLNAAYNKRNILVIVLDNSTTAMTGMQPNPLSGERINSEAASVLDYRHLAKAVGIGDDNVKIVDACKPAEIEQALDTLLASGALSLLVVKGLCMILRKRKKR